MDRVIEIAEGDVIEVRLGAQAPVPDRHADTVPGALPRLRIDAAPPPHLGLRIAVATADDTEGFAMMLPPKSDPVNLGGPNGSIGLLFEWVSDPAGTFLKVLANAKK